jgi:hypothetical protein
MLCDTTVWKQHFNLLSKNGHKKLMFGEVKLMFTVSWSLTNAFFQGSEFGGLRRGCRGSADSLVYGDFQELTLKCH